MPKAKNKTEKSKRIPIVAILGHVDHGKTSILDRLRGSNVVAKEAGGITQKISVFQVNSEATAHQDITFIDTPGHEAFDLMRQRGGTIADVVLLVVAANDGIKPQTEESIEIIKNGTAKPIVLLNKMDLPDVNVDQIKRELSGKGLMIEEYGGEVPVVPISAKTGAGFDEMLQTIMLKIEVEGFNERESMPENVLGRAFVLESVKSSAMGHVASIVVDNGTIKRGDWVVYSSGGKLYAERVKGFVDAEGKPVSELIQGGGANIIGLSNGMALGDEIFFVDQKTAKKPDQFAQYLLKESSAEAEVSSDDEAVELSEEDLLAQMFGDGEEVEEKKILKVIIKASSEGAVEALVKMLEKVSQEEAEIHIQSQGIGEITPKDVEIASITKSLIIGFDVQVAAAAQADAKKKKVLIRTYDVIYKIAEEMSDVLVMMSAPDQIEEEIGTAEVRKIFVLSNGTKVLGGRVTSGLFNRNSKCYVIRGDSIMEEGKVDSMKSGKNEISEATKGMEFGIILNPGSKLAEEGDKLHFYKVTKT